jgi:uncharacterized YigZ family protein
MNVLLEGGTAEVTEKKARFIAETAVVHSENEAAAFLEARRKKYWDARHHCSAYIIGGERPLTHSSDDGEPSGTAGRPILDVIKGFDVSDVVVVVTRYFGGTLLGTGGLVRAYSAAAKAGLERSVIARKVDGLLMSVTTGYDMIGRLQYIAAARGYTQADAEYSENVVLSYYIPTEEASAFENAVIEASGGKAKVELIGGISYAETKNGVVLL